MKLFGFLFYFINQIFSRYKNIISSVCSPTCFSASIVMGIICLGCSSTAETFEIAELQDIGKYSPPPHNIEKKAIAVLTFEDKTGGERGEAGADEMTTLLYKSKRFQVIERERIEDILKEQNLNGIAPEYFLRQGELLSADYLCVGSITNFEIKQTNTRESGGFLVSLGMFVANLFSPVRIPNLDFDYRKHQLDFYIGVDIRIINTETGEVVLAESADVKRTETAKSLGLVIAGISTRPDGTVKIDNENQGKLLRMALDKTIKKMLPQIDHYVR